MRTLAPLFALWVAVEVILGPIVILKVTVPALHALTLALGGAK